MNSGRLRCRVALGLLPFLAGAAIAAEPKVNGRLEKLGPFRVLRVWGTPAEMGFAHGYLVGKDYLAMAEEFSRNAPVEIQQRNERLQSMLHAVRLPANARDELKGIFDGMVAVEGRVPILPRSGRALTFEDIIFDNAYDFFRAFACSGFTVWGDKAGGAGLISGRNFDFVIAGPTSLANQLILVRHPNGKNQVATITWPGYIGAFTGVNEHGVCAFVHDGDGKLIRTPQGKYTPVMLVLKDFLETARPDDAHARAESMFKSIVPYPFSYMLRVIAPRVRGQVDTPIRVFRIDGSGLSENPVASLSCITTNHYLTPAFLPKEASPGWSTHRYELLTRRALTSLTEQAAWNALKTVGRGGPKGGTLHSLVVYPERRELDLGMATWSEGVVSATEAQPVRISFDKLFKARN